ncbi:MAG TPA: hypothetical protein IAA58_07755 [Candidatus Gallacutalibacter stercoravium]|nr:hypothetical protein [Candidatus Gallacutalibacter stercoravium]
MSDIILYGSKYGSTRRYAIALSEQTGIPAIEYSHAPALSDKRVIVYLGGLYAGGVLGLAKTLRGLALREEQKLILVTVGLADPNEVENKNNIRVAMQRQLPATLFDRAKIYHLRGCIDYQKLSHSHRIVMALLYQSLRKAPAKRQTAENRALIETYGKQVDFTDLNALEPIIQEIQGKATGTQL